MSNSLDLRNVKNTTMKSIIPNSTKFNKSTLFNKDFNISNIGKTTLLNLPELKKTEVDNFDYSGIGLVEKDKIVKNRNMISNLYRSTVNSQIFNTGSPDDKDVKLNLENSNSSILNNSSHINNKKLFCPFCEHCNSIQDEKADIYSSINEGKEFLNKLTETIVSSKYLEDMTPDINFKSLNFVENVIDVSNNMHIAKLFKLFKLFYLHNLVKISA